MGLNVPWFSATVISIFYLTFENMQSEHIVNSQQKWNKKKPNSFKFHQSESDVSSISHSINNLSTKSFGSQHNNIKNTRKTKK